MNDGAQLLGEAVSGQRVPSRGTMLGAGMSAAMRAPEPEKPVKDKASEDDADRLRREKAAEQSKVARLQNERLLKWEKQEIKNLRKNRVKIVNKWRASMRALKQEELTAQIEVISSSNYRELDHQIYKLKNINADVDKLNDELVVLERSHFRKTDELGDIHGERMVELQGEFVRDLEILKDEFNAEKSYIVKAHARQRPICESLLGEVERRQLTEMHEAKQVHETQREELRNKNLEDLNVLKISLEAEIEEYEKQFDETHDRYIESTEDKNRQFAELKLKDNKLSLEIEALMKRIETLQQQLTFWKKKIGSNDRERTAQIEALRKNKTGLMQQYRSLKAKMSKFRKTQNERLSNVVTSARETNTLNAEILRSGQRILKYAEIATKLQTEREKVLPFDAEEQEQQSVAEDDEPMNIGHFIKKYNNAVLDTTCFQQKRKALAAENKKLRAILKAYLEGITVSNHTIDAPNTLLVVNNSTKVQHKRGAPKVTAVVEGNQIVNAYRTQLAGTHARVQPFG